MKSTQKAFEAYFTLLNRYPQSPYAIKAKERIVVLQNRLARHEFQVAKYYFQRQAFLATTTRIKALIENYPNAQVTLPALALMRDAYKKMGMTQNAEHTQEVIQYNLAQRQDDAQNDSLSQPEANTENNPPSKSSWQPNEKSGWDQMLESVSDWF